MRPLPPKVVEPAAVSRRERGLGVVRFFTRAGRHPLDLVEWERRSVPVPGRPGEPDRHVALEVPWFWSRSAARTAAIRLLASGVDGARCSIRQAIARVVSTLAAWAREGRYFEDAEATVFEDELAHLLLHQMLAFGFPAWLGLGLDPEPQCCACPISSVGESMTSALDLARSEGQPLRLGSGSGANLSSLRSAEESGAAGALAGPLLFLDRIEALTSVIRSGESSRPASSIAILNVDHPDIRRFIAAASRRATPDGGRPPRSTSRAVRLSDAFMSTALADGWWETRAVGSGEVVGRERASALLRLIAATAASTGEPQVQFDDTINRWNTCAAWGRINASSPCAEYTFLDDTAGQLATLNLLPFQDGVGWFRGEAFRHAVDVAVLALEVMVGATRYPTARIAARTRELRPLALSYANLGALLMASGLAYDSDAGRAVAAAVTSLMTGEAFLQSARIAAAIGSFAAYPANRTAMLEVVDRHREAARALRSARVPFDLLGPAVEVWDEALTLGTRSGFRNAQVTALAPTGAVARLMDCVAPGVDPVPMLQAQSDGARPMTDVVARALERLGYGPDERRATLDHLATSGRLEGCERLDRADLGVFDCAGSIPPAGLLRMVAAVQPFLSGAVAATLRFEPTGSEEEPESLLVEAWRLGVKTLGFRRKPGSDDPADDERAVCQTPCAEPRRRPLPEQRQVLTHAFAASGHEAHVTVGLYEDGSPGELSITLAREASALSGVVDTFATAISDTLQSGVPLGSVLDSLSRLRLEPSAAGVGTQVARTTSVLDHVARWLEARFLSTAPRDCPACGTSSPGCAQQTPIAHAEPTGPPPALPLAPR